MMRFIGDLRLIPIVLIASVCLLVLKAADLLLDRGVVTAEDAVTDDVAADDAAMHVVRPMPDLSPAAPGQRSWAQQMFNFPNAGDGAADAPPAIVPPLASLPVIASRLPDKGNADITGSVTTPGENGAAEAKTDAGGSGGKGDNNSKSGGDSNPADGKAADSKPADSKPGSDAKPANGTVIVPGAPAPSGAERAILERLVERRQQLEARAHELEIREGLVAAAEKRVEARLAEIKAAEAHIAAATEKKDEADSVRLKSLVTMYENMKPRDAAKIFDRLEIGVLIEVASQINPRRMSDILALMSPDTAERLTVELANRANAAGKPGADLPKIEGRPTAP